MSPDGQVLASGSSDGAVRLWRVPDGEALRTLRGHTGAVHCVAMSPDGRVLASAGRGYKDGVVRLWSVPEGEALCTLEHTGDVYHVAISPDGRVLASGGADGAVRLWGLEPLRLSYLPLGHTSVEDMAWVQQTLQSGDLSQTEREWLEFLLAMMRWQRRFDIGVGEASQSMEVGEFDIILDG